MELNELFYQNYWWFLISLLGALLVFLLFVQGGQSLLAVMGKTETEKSMMVNSLGRKWEFTFTTLVVFGGAFFASFPLFYSTSFGGAYWLWMAILFSFIIQAVSYEYRSKSGNFIGKKTYDTFLLINGIVGPILLGIAVGSFFTGSDFIVDTGNLTTIGSPVISSWTNDWHGLEAILDVRNLLLGFTVLFLARTQGALYFMNNIKNDSIFEKSRKQVLFNGVLFVILFLSFVTATLLADGYEVATDSGIIAVRPYKYFFNFVEMPWVAILFFAGVVLVFIAGYNHTAYYPSSVDMQSSLTIYNSSSSLFTLKTMSIVSLLIPFVLAYIVYVWRAMDAKPITAQEMESNEHKY